MKAMVYAMLAGAMLVGGCGDDRDLVDATDNEAALTRNFQQEIAALPEPQRNGVFIRAIRDAGLPCQGVTESERLPGAELTYRARCQGGRDHVVSITASGTAQIVTGSTP